ncbi:MAG: hypothetical protein KatS3mg008_0214 [Acidimicrobiales bacterium]|nr:MAG: hypothetical protein KatS3mg008_0214 [Acidimicrobiales bacterium]
MLAACAVMAVAAGAVLRFWTVSDLWLDEALTVNIASLPVADIPRALRSDGLPPLYYVMLHFWMGLFGEGDVAVRSMSGVFSVATLPVAWLAGKRCGGPRVGVILVATVASCPFLVRYATEARMYSLLSLLVFCGWLVVSVMGERPRLGQVAAGAVVSGALLLTHYWAAFLVASVVLVSGLAARNSDGARRRRLSAIALVSLAGSVFFLPWLPIFLDQLGSTGTPWAGPQRPLQMLAVTLGDLGGAGATSFRDGQIYGILLAFTMVVALTGRGTSDRTVEVGLRTVPGVRGELAVAAVGFSIAAAVSWLTSSAYATRYASVFVPLLLLAAAVGIERTGRTGRAYLLPVVVLLGLAGSFYVATRERTQAGVIAAEIAEHSAAGDLVVYCPDQLGPAVHRLLQRWRTNVREVVYHPRFLPPDRIDWVDYAERHARTDPAGFARRVRAEAGDWAIWLVHSPTYEGVGSVCDELVALLGEGRRTVQVTRADGDRYFEHASLTKLEPL